MDVLNNCFANCFCIGFCYLWGCHWWQPLDNQGGYSWRYNCPTTIQQCQKSTGSHLFLRSAFSFLLLNQKNSCTMLLSCWQLGQILWKRDLVRFHSNRMSLFHSILRLGGKLSLRTYDEGAFAINCDSCADNPCLKWLVVLWHEYIFLVCSWKVWIFISGASIAWIHTWFLKYSSTCVSSHLWFCFAP